jgi:hypothetical protein
MTDFQELQLKEYNLILKLCFEKKRLLKDIAKEFTDKSESAVRKKIYLLKEVDLIEQAGGYYKSKFEQYPADLYEHVVDQKYKTMSAAMKNDANGRRVHFKPNYSTLGDAVYIHRMERLDDKYKAQMRQAHQEYKRPKVYVGSIGEMV